ncbi:Adenosine kinase [subsurface metagenome]|nr:carbohydrate kinase family protein [Candidatus Lokiarchaeota archaeon]MCK4480163.1 carbohydrate kinase family protein [Candidatus Lokiarchaeota archaeon]
MLKNKVLVLGSLAFDYIMGFKESFLNAVSINHDKEEYQSTVTADSRYQFFGGTAGNITYNLGLLSIAKVSLLGSVGNDFERLGYMDHINQFKNVDLGVDVYEDLFTAACYIVNDIKSNQMIIFHGGALDRCKDIQLKEKVSNPEEFIYAINSTQSVEAMTNFAIQLSDLRIKTIFDPGQVTPLFQKDSLINIIKKSEILIGNAHEIKQIKEKSGLTEENILEHIKAIIITKGSEGSILIYKNENNKIFKIKIPIATPAKIVDTTGAGDGYRAGILTGLTLDMTLLDSCRLGAIIGSFVVETSGAQTQKFNIDKVRKRFFNTFNYIPPELERA